MPSPSHSPTYAPIDLDERVLKIRENYEKEKKIPSLDKAKRGWFQPTFLGYPYIKQRRAQIELLEKLAGMVKYKTKSGDNGYQYNVGAYQLLMTACFLIRKQIENEEYSIKHSSYGTLHKLIGEALDIPLGNKLENEILNQCLAFVTQINPHDYDMPGEHRIPPEVWAKLKKLATDLQRKIALKETQPGACEKTLGLAGYVLMPFGWAFGYFAGAAFSFSTVARPMVSALGVVFNGLFGIAARHNGGGNGGAMWLSGRCAEQVASYGFGYAGAMAGTSLAYVIGKKGGGFVGWMLDASSEVLTERIKALYVSLQKQEQLPVRYGYDLKTHDLVFFNVDGDIIDMKDVLSADNIEAVIKSGETDSLTEEDQQVVSAFAKDIERLKPELLKLEEKRQQEQEDAAAVTKALAM